MKKLSLIFISIIFTINLSFAEEYNFYLDNLESCNNFGADPATLGNTKVKVKYLDLTYDDQTQILTVETEVDNSRDELAEFFHFVLTNGDMPLGEGSVAHLYFDATDILHPKVNLFSYNGHGNNKCNNGEDLAAASWEQGSTSNTLAGYYTAPDPILSISEDPDSTGQILEITATTNTVAGLTTNFYRLKIDLSEANLFRPKVMNLGHSYSYQGIRFDDLVGVWFWAAATPTSSYNSNGFLNNLVTTICAVCDQVDFETKRKPLCSDSTVTLNPLEVGETTTIEFTISNQDLNDTEAAPILISYSGIPEGAKLSVPDGSALVFDSNGESMVSINWTPEEGQEGEYEIGVSVHTDYGLDQLVETCGNVTVTVNEENPECKEADLDPISQADQGLSQLANLAEQIDNKSRKIANQLKIDFVPVAGDSEAEFLAGWQAYHEIVGDGGVYFYECNNVEACVGGLQVTNLSSQLGTFSTSLEDLKSIVERKIDQLRKLLVKKFIKVNKLTRAQARARAVRVVKRDYQKGANNNGLDPVFASTSSLVQLHVNSYGLNRYTCENAEIL